MNAMQIRLLAALLMLCGGLLLPLVAQDIPLSQMRVSDTPLDALALSADGLFIATGSRDHTVRLWHAATGEFILTLEGHTAWVMSAAFSTNTRQLATGDYDGTLILWDLRSGQRQHTLALAGELVALAYDAADSVLYAAARSGQIYRIQPDNAQTTLLYDAGAPLWDMALHPGGRWLAVAVEAAPIAILETSSGGLLAQIDIAPAPIVTSLAFAPDGERLAAAYLDGSLMVWAWPAEWTSTRTLEPIHQFSRHAAPVLGLTFAGAADLLLSASLDGTLRLWDLQTNQEDALRVFTNAPAPLTQVVFATAIHTVLVVGTHGQVVYWSLPPADVARWRAEVAPTALALRPSVTPASAVSPVSPSSAGRTLAIPRLGLQTELTTFPLNSSGTTWAIDPWEPRAGHFAYTAWLRETGNIIIGGHSEYPDGKPGIFASLYAVNMGDEIIIRDDALQRRYQVSQIVRVDYRDLSVIIPTTHNRVTLITCDIPSYVAEQNLYYERLVIIADEIP